MTTVAELAARDFRDVAWLLVVEGWPWVFTDRSELAGSDYFAKVDGRVVLEGLTVPESITLATGLENGMLSSEDQAVFQIEDFDRKLIGLIDATNTGTLVGETLGPKDDPAPATILDGTGLNNVSLHGKWVNHEAIGPAGERRYYPCMPVSLPGPDHAAVYGTSQTLAPSFVRDSPTWYEGVRCALYAIFRDIDTGEWPAWDEQHESGESLIWWGSLTEFPTCEALTWTLTCDGPSSWLRRQLGGNRSAEWLPAWATLTLSTADSAREDLAAYYFSYRTNTSWERGAGSYYAVADALPSSGTAADYRAAIQTRLNTVAGTAGPDTTWTTSRNASCKFYQGRIELQVDDFGYAANAYVCLHARVWRALGYDCIAQASTTPQGDYLKIDFVDPSDLGYELAPFSAVPGPGYYLARLSTIPVQYDSLVQAGTDADGDGKVRVYLAIHDEDVSTLLPQGQQELTVGLGPSSVPYLEGQLCRAPVEHTISNSGGAVDSVAFIALRGSYKAGADAEVVTMAAIARVGFHDDNSFGGHGPSVDSNNELRLFVQDYIDPRFVGVDRKFDSPWTSLDLEWLPVNYLGTNVTAGDRADLILLRTMLSTGGSSWTGYDGQGAVQTLGDNAHPDADAPQGSDVEIADLGLAIPYSLIDAASFVATAELLPEGGKNSPLNRVKFAYIGSFDSQDFVWRVIEQRGWAMGLVRGQYRLFSRAQLLDPDDVEVSLGPDDFNGDITFVEQADLAPLTPRDGFEIEYGKPLIEGTGTDLELVAKVRASDPQSRTRRTNNVESVDGRGLIPTRLWADEPGAPPSFIPAWSKLAGRDMANWFAQPWVAVDVPVLWSVARKLGPGSIVSFSSHYAPNREGTYGMLNRLGRVVSKKIDLKELTAEVRVLVQPGDPSTLRRFGPVAVVLDDVATVEARHDAAAKRIYCYADFWGHGAGGHDVSGFVEPNWSTVGGNAKAIGYQWNGLTWSNTFSITVASVSTTTDSITYSSMTGTFWQARPTIIVLADFDSQTPGSWPQAVYSVICRYDGLFGSVPTAGFPLVDQ